MTVPEVLQKSELNNVNVVIIDTEGYDAEIVNSLDLTPNALHTVVFEHKLLNSEDLDVTVTVLEREGFSIQRDKSDVLAIRNEADDGKR